MGHEGVRWRSPGGDDEEDDSPGYFGGLPSRVPALGWQVQSDAIRASAQWANPQRHRVTRPALAFRHPKSR